MLKIFARRYILATAVLLGGALCGVPAQAAFKQTPGSHITILQCYPHRHAVGTRHAWIDPYGRPRDATLFRVEDGFLAIDYRNDASLAATEVDFGLVSRRLLIATANDVGSFARGVQIEHEFVLSSEIFPIGTAVPYCAILRVKYADGSVWHNPMPPPQ